LITRTLAGLRRAIRRRAAFSLVELLAAGSCLALLAILLPPSLHSAATKSRQELCLERLQQIGQANLIYSGEDYFGSAIPVHPKQFQQNPTAPSFIGAYEWGGKSGIGGTTDAPSTFYDSRWGSKKGFGPATRPLNTILYPHGFQDNGSPTFNRTGSAKDTQLALEA